MDNTILLGILRWHLDNGVDETIGDKPINRLENIYSKRSVQTDFQNSNEVVDQNTTAMTIESHGKTKIPQEIIKSAIYLAREAQNINQLKLSVEKFDGCALKKTATNLVFFKGEPEAQLMFVGEAPGAHEDRKGIPFVGPSGLLLDKMIKSIGINHSNVMVSNTVFWRPPGNRTPTLEETSICRPFLERLIEIVEPKVLVALGGPAAKILMDKPQSISQLRGRWFNYQSPQISQPIHATAMFHPAYLLRTPKQKKFAWHDLLSISQKFSST